MAVILNLETATDVCSVCISDDFKVLSLEEALKPFDHAASLTLLIERCLESASVTLDELQAIAVSSGPGSYTSLRVGISTAKGICYALDLPMISVDTLQALAMASVYQEDTDVLYCPMIDARRMDVYYGIYSQDGFSISGTNMLTLTASSFDAFLVKNKKVIFCGNGAVKCKDIIKSPNAIFRNFVCSAEYLVKPAIYAYKSLQFVDVASFAPKYLKSPNITTPRKNPLSTTPK
jgi:tRNA threonylcarbamoyladenosine biosynthesis protein TsaB